MKHRAHTTALMAVVQSTVQRELTLLPSPFPVRRRVPIQQLERSRIVQLGRQDDTVSATDDYAQVRGSPPYETVSTGKSKRQRWLTQQGVTLRFDGFAKQLGTVGPQDLEIEVPQGDGTLADIHVHGRVRQ